MKWTVTYFYCFFFDLKQICKTYHNIQFDLWSTICFNSSCHLYYGCLQSNFGDGGHWIRKFGWASLTTAYEIDRLDKHFAFHCFAFTIGTAFVNSWSSSFPFKVLKDIEAMDQTISKYSEVLRFSWCRAFLFFFFKLMSIFMALKSICMTYNFQVIWLITQVFLLQKNCRLFFFANCNWL